MQKNILVGFAVLIVVVSSVYLGGTRSLQRRVLYPQPQAPAGEPRLPPRAESVWLGAEENVEAWFLRPRSSEHKFPVLIFAHGNAELIDHWAPRFSWATRLGIGVMLVEYPGYGRSGGSPSQDSITDAMLSAHTFVVEQEGVDPDAVIGYGRSLGGGAVCALARERALSALVLESTFTSARDVAASLGFPSAWVVDPYENLDVVRSLDIPVLVLHGNRDTLIPVSHGEALALAAESELVRRPCGHNDCGPSSQIVEMFLSDHGLLNR